MLHSQDMTAAAWGASSAAAPRAPADTISAASAAGSWGVPPHATADAPLPLGLQAPGHAAEPPLQAGSAPELRPVAELEDANTVEDERGSPSSQPESTNETSKGSGDPAHALQLRQRPQRPSAPETGAQATSLVAAVDVGQASVARMHTEHRDSAGGGSSPGEPRHGQPKQAKSKPAVIPHIAALGALVGALARANDVDAALRLYAQARQLAQLRMLHLLHAVLHARHQAFAEPSGRCSTSGSWVVCLVGQGGLTLQPLHLHSGAAAVAAGKSLQYILQP